VRTPKVGEKAQLVTTDWDTGPDGDRDPSRPIADIVSRDANSDDGTTLPARARAMPPQPARRSGKHEAVIQRTLYFSQVAPNVSHAGFRGGEEGADVSVFYYLTVVGQTPKLYEMNAPPNIVVHQGDVEDWTVENRAREDHVFHIHQLHFRVLEVNGKPSTDPDFRDTVDLPYWKGSGPYPSVKLRLDFSGPHIVGTFLYHCHILKHEDMGMMGAIEVLPPGIRTVTTLTAPAAAVNRANKVTVTARVMSPLSSKPQPSGTVQFLMDGLTEGQSVALSNGSASFVMSFPEPGRHNMMAVYSGNSKYDESASLPLTLVASP
jgi:Multicopper oxidase/Bacterial Ig-like domain (group 3)